MDFSKVLNLEKTVFQDKFSDDLLDIFEFYKCNIKDKLNNVKSLEGINTANFL